MIPEPVLVPEPAKAIVDWDWLIVLELLCDWTTPPEDWDEVWLVEACYICPVACFWAWEDCPAV